MSIKHEQDLRHIRFWRRVRKIVVLTVVSLAVLLLLAPSLIPSAILSRTIAQSLEKELGRPVHVGRASLGWFSGLTLDELSIDRGGDHAGQPIVHAQALHFDFPPWELPRAVFSAPPYLGRLTIARLDLRVVRGADGRFDLPESSGPPPDFKSVEILDGTVDLVDEADGSLRQINSLRVAVRRVEESDRASVTAGGWLLLPDRQGAADLARLSVGGLLDHFDLNHVAGITGGCDVDWDGLDLAYLFPALAGGDTAGGLVVRARTSGQASFRIHESDLVSFEGNVSTPQLVVGQETAPPEVQLERSIVSFSGSWNKATGQVEILPVQFSGAGSSVRIAGRLDCPPGGILSGELTLTGTLNWNPLKHQVQALGRAIRLLPEATVSGTANIQSLVLRIDGAEVLFRGAVDLRRTELLWQSYFEKPPDVGALFTVDGRLRLESGELTLTEAALLVNPPRAAEAATPADLAIVARTVAANGPAPESLEVTVRVADVDQLRRYVPLVGPYVRQWQVAGPLTVVLGLSPRAEGRPVAIRVDAGGTRFETAPEVGKPAGTPMTVEANGLLRGADGRPELRHVAMTLAESSIEWTGRLAEAPLARTGRRLAFSGAIEARGVQHWLRLVRPFLPARPFVGVVGNISIEDLSGAVSQAGAEIDLGVIDATRASLEVNPAPGRVDPADRLLAKPLGRMTKGHFTAGYVASSGTLTVESQMSFDGGAVSFNGLCAGLAAALGGPQPAWPEKARFTLGLQADDLKALVAISPAIDQAVAPYHPAGGLAAQLVCEMEDTVHVQGLLDLEATECDVADRLGGITKKAGQPLRVTAEFEVPRQVGNGPAEFHTQFSVETGPSHLACHGDVSLDLDALRRARTGDAARAVRSLAMTGELAVVQDDRLKNLSAWWRRFSEEHAVVGQATAKAKLSGNRDRGEFSLSIDATGAGFTYGQGTGKPEGVEARLDIAARTTPVAGEIALEQAALRIAGTEADCQGMLYGRHWAPLVPGEPLDFALRLKGRSDQLARLAQLVPVGALRELEPQGGVEFSLDLARDRYGLELRSGEFTFRDARFKYHQVPMFADGHVSLGRDRFLVEALKVGLDDSSLSLSADIARPFEQPSGAFSLTGARLDLDRIMTVLGLAKDRSAPPPVGIPAEWPAIRALLARTNVTGNVAFDEFHWTDETGYRYDWTAFASDLAVAGGEIRVPTFKAVMLGGVVIGRASCRLDQDNPNLRTEYAASHLAGGEKLTPMIARLFPNMTVEGTAEQVYQAEARLFSTKEQRNYPVGLSQFSATRGRMVGPGAPAWLADLLPGLKLAAYDFQRMESISTLRPNGRADSVMLFEGSPYSLYIVGHTNPDGAANYALGVDLFNSLGQSENIRKLEQGWVPLTVYAGRIAKSQWVEQTVSFKLPHEVAYELFLQRSLVAKLLQQSGETRRPNFDPYDFKDK